jgi:hypothetical protein
MQGYDESEEGMMLAEVLVGLAILSLVTLTMFRIFAVAASSIRHVDQVATRYDIAENLLSHYSLDGVKAAGEESGQSGSVNWWVEATPVESNNAVGSLKTYRIGIRVEQHDTPPLLTSIVFGSGS